MRGRVFITGGAGYLGRAILRQAERAAWDAEFTVFSRDEEKQHQVRNRWPGVHCVLGDVRDYERLALAMHGHDIVIDAAAVKFVPEAEGNVAETVAVNIQGAAVNVARAARAADVRAVIGISTDKACLPVNLYGATKMVMERIFTEANRLPGRTRFNVARYGNVVGSTGSIVPVLERQLEKNGRVTVTDPAMTRFWLTADDGVDLIRRALVGAECGAGGNIYVPRCGAMTIGDLASLLVRRHYGEERWDGPNGVMDMIGPRPGEKMHEALLHPYELNRTLDEPWGFVVQGHGADPIPKAARPWREYSSDVADPVSRDWMAAAIDDAGLI